MSNVIDAVMNQIGDDHVAAIAQQLGTDPATAQNAIEHAVPLLVGAMSHTAGTPSGADLLHNLASGHANFDSGGLLGSILGGGANSSAGTAGGGGLGGLLGGLLGSGGAGGGILGQIFGAHQDHVNDGLGQATGLGSGRAAQLIAMLAPMVLAAMGRMTQNRGMSAGDLQNELAQQTQAAHAGGGGVADLLSSVLGRLGGGSGGGGFNLGGLLGGAFGQR